MSLTIPRYDNVIGLPSDGRAIVITNSERDDLACPTRWWFRHVERLRGPETGPQRFGTLWHLWLEELHRWWMLTDSGFPASGLMSCPFCSGTGRPEGGPPAAFALDLSAPHACVRCGGTGDGLIVRIGHQIAASVRSAEERGVSFTAEDGQELIEHLYRTIQGWIYRYGTIPSPKVKVVGVEVGLARPILNPKTGTPYAPETYLAKLRAGGYRFAETGEAAPGAPLPAEVAEIVSVRWPWYQIGRLDWILRDRTRPVLWVGEGKTSSDPRGLIEDLSLDPQTAGYAWLLAHHAPRFGAEDVVGAVFDVTSSSYHHDPEPLKGRPTKAVPNPPLAFSQARNRVTPSWRYVETLKRHGVDPAPYQEHLLHLAETVDPRLYQREWPSLGEEERRRYAEEVYATAARIANLRRLVARAEDVTDLTIAVPRVPICRLPGGGCQFRAPCLLDGENTRSKFVIGPTLVWAR